MSLCVALIHSAADFVVIVVVSGHFSHSLPSALFARSAIHSSRHIFLPPRSPVVDRMVLIMWSKFGLLSMRVIIASRIGLA